MRTFGFWQPCLAPCTCAQLTKCWEPGLWPLKCIVCEFPWHTAHAELGAETAKYCKFKQIPLHDAGNQIAVLCSCAQVQQAHQLHQNRSCFARKLCLPVGSHGNSRVAFAPSCTVLDSALRTSLRINEPVASRCICFGRVKQHMEYMQAPRPLLAWRLMATRS